MDMCEWLGGSTLHVFFALINYESVASVLFLLGCVLVGVGVGDDANL